MKQLTLTEMCLLSSTCASGADSSLLLLEKGLIDQLSQTAGSSSDWQDAAARHKLINKLKY